MLGSLRSKNLWTWGIFGKHPAVRDFIGLGPDSPIFTAFSTWVQRGYQMIESGRNQQLHSWRFWAKGIKKSQIVCGLVRDSHDSIKRPFPCLIIGTGFLKDWEEHWSELPMALEFLWVRMEYLFVRKFNSSGELTNEIKGLQQLSASLSDKKTLPDNDHDGTRIKRDNRDQKMHHGDFFCHSLNSADPSESAVHYLREMTTQIGSAPNAVFLGGTPANSLLVLYTRSLVPADFVTLWSEYNREEINDGYVVTGK